MSEEKNMEGRHVGLDFYDLLIEVLLGFIASQSVVASSWRLAVGKSSGLLL